MKTTSTDLVKPQGVPMSYLKSLEPNQRQILEAMNQTPLKEMTPTQRYNELKKFIVVLHVITGWPIPEKEYREIFLNQLEKKLIEEFGYLNFAELELAFRQNHEVRAFGASMNLSLITDVLNDFKVVRLEVAKKARQAAENGLKIDPLTDEQMINKARGEIQFYYNERKKGNDRPIMFSYWKEILIHDKFMREDQEMADFFDFCLEKKVKNIYLYEPPIGKYEYKHYDNQDLPF